MIVIVDHGMGNLGSVQNMLRKIGADERPDRRSARRSGAPTSWSWPGSVRSTAQRSVSRSWAWSTCSTSRSSNDRCRFWESVSGCSSWRTRARRGASPGSAGSMPRSGASRSSRGIDLPVPHMGWEVDRAHCARARSSPMALTRRGPFLLLARLPPGLSRSRRCRRDRDVWIRVPGGRPSGQHPRDAVPSGEEPRLRRRGLSAVRRASVGVIPRVIPVLLLEDGGLVKTVKFREPRYVGDPINAVRIFNDKQVDELIVLDIRASAEGRAAGRERPSRRSRAKRSCRSATAAASATSRRRRGSSSSGVEKVVVNTAAVEAPAEVARIADRLGRSTLVVSIDAARRPDGRYEVVTHGAQPPHRHRRPDACRGRRTPRRRRGVPEFRRPRRDDGGLRPRADPAVAGPSTFRS